MVIEGMFDNMKNAHLVFASNITPEEVNTIETIWKEAENPYEAFTLRFDKKIIATYHDDTYTFYFIKPEGNE